MTELQIEKIRQIISINATGNDKVTMLVDIVEDYNIQQNKTLTEQLEAITRFLDKRCIELDEMSVTIHNLEKQLTITRK